MNIIINQIGECITDIFTNTTRILIDLGQTLPNRVWNVQDDLVNFESIGKLTKGIDAIFYIQNHGITSLRSFPFCI